MTRDQAAASSPARPGNFPGRGARPQAKRKAEAR